MVWCRMAQARGGVGVGLRPGSGGQGVGRHIKSIPTVDMSGLLALLRAGIAAVSGPCAGAVPAVGTGQVGRQCAKASGTA